MKRKILIDDLIIITQVFIILEINSVSVTVLTNKQGAANVNKNQKIFKKLQLCTNYLSDYIYNNN